MVKTSRAYKNIKHSFHLSHNGVRSIYFSPYKTRQKARPFGAAEMDHVLAENIEELATTESAPIVFGPEKDGSFASALTTRT